MSITIRPGMKLGPGTGIRVPTIPSIVTDGILLNFDAATYTSGDWIDSANGVHATPQNSPVWSSDDGGTFVLIGTSHFIVPWPTFQPTFTIDIWFNFTSNQPGAACLISDEFSGAPNGSSPTQRFFIGHRWELSDTIQGKIAVVNIYDRALTDLEVAQNYNYYRARFGL